MFSSRLPASLVPTPLAAAYATRRAGGGHLRDLTLSNPTIAGLAYPETLAAAWSNAGALHYDPQPRGARTAREAIAAWYASTGERVDPEDLVVTASTSEAYSHLFKLLCDPGDEVLVPCPSYPLFEHLAQLDAVAVTRYAWRDAGRWMLDEDDLHAAISPRTRVLVVVAPNNPTGSVPSPAEWATLADACRRHGLALIVDEVFAAYPLGAAPAAMAAHLPDDVLAFRLNGLSKLVGLPQAKLGWIAVAGPRVQRQAALDGLELVADTYLSVSTPVQMALPALLAAGAIVRTQIGQRLRGNLHTLAALVAGSAIGVRPPDGGWSAVLRVPCLGDPDDLPLALLAADVLVHPGYFYDLPSDGYLVVSLLTPEGDFRAGVGVLCALPSLLPA